MIFEMLLGANPRNADFGDMIDFWKTTYMD